MNKNIAVPITSKLQVIEGDEQAKAWVAKDESTPSPLPFQRRVIYEYMDSIPKDNLLPYHRSGNRIIMHLKPLPSEQKLKRDTVRNRMPIVERKERKSEYLY